MKKILALIICILTLVGLCSCKEDTPVSGNSGNDGGTKKNTYYMTYNGVNIKMNANVDTVIPKIKETPTKSESASCAGVGTDVLYIYKSIEITTLKTDKAETIEKVKLLNDSVMTPKGVGVGSSKDEIIKAYGKKYTEENGHIKYSDSTSTLTFFMKDGYSNGVQFNAK